MNLEICSIFTDVDGEAYASRQERLKAQKTIKQSQQREKAHQQSVEKSKRTGSDCFSQT